MPTLVLLALAGFGAQLVDGAIGMGYGVTSTTLLLLAGGLVAVAVRRVPAATRRAVPSEPLVSA